MSVALASTFSQLVLVYAEAQSPKQNATPDVVVLLTCSCGIRGHAQLQEGVCVSVCICVQVRTQTRLFLSPRSYLRH